MLRLKKERGVDLEEAELTTTRRRCREKGHFYMPVQCQQCANPPCVPVCPVGATWQEPDGIVVIDYNWCIGCRVLHGRLPLRARRFNWNAAEVPPKK